MGKQEPVVQTFPAVGQSGPIHIYGEFNFSLSGSWSGTIKVQRSFDAGATWLDVESFTSNGEFAGYEPEGAAYRVICSSYTSGAATARLGS